MRDFISGILQTKTVRQSGITFGGTFVSATIGVFFYILIARFLGPSLYGVFSASIVTLTLVADIASLGVGTGIVRFVGKYIHEDKDKALKILKLSLLVNLTVWLVVLIIGWLVMPFIANGLLKKPELVVPLRLAMFGVGGALLTSFATNTLQAIQRFWAWAGVNIFSNVLRLVFLFLLFSLGYLNVQTGLVGYILPLFIGFGIGLIFSPNFFRIKGEREVFKELFSYNKWVAGFIVIAAVSSRLDTFLATRLLSFTEVGIYSVGASLTGIVPQIIYALGTVVAPKLAGFDSKQKAWAYLKKLQLFVLGLAAIGIIIGIPLSRLVIPVFYGDQYLPSMLPFTVLLFSQALFLMAVPAHTSIFYYFARPDIFVWVSLGHLAIVGGLGYYLIGSMGYMGAAYTMLLGNVFNLVVPFIWAIRKFKGVKDENRR